MPHDNHESLKNYTDPDIQWQLQQFIDSVEEYAIFMLDTTGHIITWNEGARRIKGYDESEIVGRHFSCFYTSEAQSANDPEQYLQIATESGRWHGEGWRVRQDGTMFWADVTITALFKDDVLSGFAKITKNLSNRTSSIVELTSSDVLFSSILESCYSAIISVAPDKRIILFNDAAETIFGYSSREIMGQSINRLIPDIFHARHDQYVSDFATSETINKVMASHRNQVIYGKRKNGDIFPAKASISKIKWQEQPVFTVILQDISEHEQAQQQLQQMVVELERTQQRLKTYMNHTPAMIYAKDKSGKFTYTNKQFEQYKINVQDKSIEDFDLGDVAQEISDHDQKVFNTGQPLQTEQHIKYENQDFWFLLTKAPVFDDNGNVAEILAISIDISERKLAEQALADERNVLRTLINAIPSLVAIKDRQGRVITANDAFLEHTYYTRYEDIIRRTSTEIFPHSGEAGHRNDMECMETEEPIRDREELVRINDGSQRWYSVSKIPLKNEDGFPLARGGIMWR